MSCYRPLIGIPVGETERGLRKFRFEGNLDPYQAKVTWPDSVLVPCGKCLGCRLDYARKWADRMYLEMQCHDKAIFVTLTYDEENIPFRVFVDYENDEFEYEYTLRRRDVQLFFKRLRKRFPNVKIRYFCTGEYASRPHYHAIIYDLGLEDFPDLEYYKANEFHQPMYISREFERIWTNGLCVLAEASYETCGYTARYVTKKAFHDYVESDRRESEFCCMSRRPGIGKPFLDEHPEVLDSDYIILGDSFGSHKIKVPDYFYDLLEKEAFSYVDKNGKKVYDNSKIQNMPAYNRWRELRERRRSLAFAEMVMDHDTLELPKLEQLLVDERHKAAVVQSLKRDKC